MQQAATPAPRAIVVVLALVALAALLGPALVVAFGPRVAPRPALVHAARVVPQAELPPVEPVTFQALTPEDARAINAAIPFVDAANPAARPFRLPGGEVDRARATDCLAAAVLYEAGDDAVGERAVAQVVLNRARHPAYPKTVCGVVFQGSERTTGCQFTFTCDGALARVPGEAAWRRAREVAAAALAGGVYAPVGYATHYHTDWVVPYWRSSLDKIAEVHTHLFYRWTGWWGTPAAFGRQVQPGEPAEPKLAFLSDAHRTGALATDAGIVPLDAALAGNADARPVIESSNAFLLTIDRGATPAGMAALTQRVCGERAYCKILGWTNAAQRPAALPLTAPQMAAMSFSYLRDRGTGFEKALWNCGEFPKVEAASCMRRTVLPARGADSFRLEALGDATAPTDARPAVPAAAQVPVLTGVRMRAAPVAASPVAAKPGLPAAAMPAPAPAVPEKR